MFIFKKLFFFLVLIFIYFQAQSVSRFSIDEQENIRIYEKCRRAVVNISNITVNYDFYYRAIPSESGSGTGFLIDKSGTILTNYHVVENASELVVTLSDNSQWPGRLIGADPNNDLAIVGIKAPSEKPDILWVISELEKLKIKSLLVEGGSLVHASFLKSNYVNQLALFISPKIIGGQGALSWCGDLNVDNIEEASKFDIVSITKLGDDFLISANSNKVTN